MDLLRALEKAATAEVGPRVEARVGSFLGGQLLTFSTDDGFEWENAHLEDDPPDNPWVVIRQFVRAYRAWFDAKADEFLNNARSNHERPDA